LCHRSDDRVVTLGGRQVPISRPRARTADGIQEVAPPAYQPVGSTGLLGQMALKRMLAKVSNRRRGRPLDRCRHGRARGRRGPLRRSCRRRGVGHRHRGDQALFEPVVEDDSETATLVTALLVGRRARRLDVTTPILFVRDGAKALSWAV
jgi:putative transposase